MKRRSAGQTCAMLGMLLALALLCGYIESLIPISFGVPGIKLGLPNLVVVITLYLLGPKEALVVSVARILLSGFLYGTMFGVVYGLAGGIFSFFIMLLLKQGAQCSPVTVSAAGGITHNLGQLLVAVLVVENRNLLYYLPALFFAGFLTGLLIGIVSREVLLRLRLPK